MKRILSSILFLAPFLLFGQSFKMVMENRTHNGAAPDIEESTLYMTESKLRTDNKGEEGRTSIIYDDEKKVLYTIDHSAERYTVITEEDMKRLEEQMERVREQLKNMPEEQREQMEQMMGDKLKESSEKEIRYKKTGNSKNVEQWGECDEYEGVEEGEKVSQVYTTPMNKVALKEQNFEVLRSMIEFLDFTDLDLGKMMPVDPEAEMKDNGLEGFGVHWVHLDKEGNKSYESIVKELEAESVDASVFKLPDGYKKQEMQMGGQGRH